VRHLQQRGVLIPGDDGMARPEQVLGSKVHRFYVLSRARLTP
jgi:hypothetical protein